MQKVQQALANIGIPVFALSWKPTQNNQQPPAQYVVYTTHITEDEHWDDAFVRYKILVYLNLWSKTDPKEMTRLIRSAMRQGGFSLSDESDEFEDDTQTFRVSSTYVIWEGAENGVQNEQPE